MRNLGQKRTLEIFTEILFPSLFLPGCVAASMHTHTSFSEVLLFKTTVIRISAPVPSEKQTAFFFFLLKTLSPLKNPDWGMPFSTICVIASELS